MEETRYSRHTRPSFAGSATRCRSARFVYRLMRLGHRRVRLTSQNPQTDSQGRLFRYLAVKIGGRWRTSARPR